MIRLTVCRHTCLHSLLPWQRLPHFNPPREAAFSPSRPAAAGGLAALRRLQTSAADGGPAAADCGAGAAAAARPGGATGAARGSAACLPGRRGGSLPAAQPLPQLHPRSRRGAGAGQAGGCARRGGLAGCDAGFGAHGSAGCLLCNERPRAASCVHSRCRISLHLSTPPHTPAPTLYHHTTHCLRCRRWAPCWQQTAGRRR